MPNPEFLTDMPERSETKQEQEIRIQREAAVLAAARADVEDGNRVPWSETKAWLISRERNPSLPAPEPRRGPVLR